MLPHLCLVCSPDLMEVGGLVEPSRAPQTRAAVEKYAAARRASALEQESWTGSFVLSHLKPGHFYIVCAVFLWTNQGLSCLTRLIYPSL